MLYLNLDFDTDHKWYNFTFLLPKPTGSIFENVHFLFDFSLAFDYFISHLIVLVTKCKTEQTYYCYN